MLDGIMCPFAEIVSYDGLLQIELIDITFIRSGDTFIYIFWRRFFCMYEFKIQQKASFFPPWCFVCLSSNAVNSPISRNHHLD